MPACFFCFSTSPPAPRSLKKMLFTPVSRMCDPRRRPAPTCVSLQQLPKYLTTVSTFINFRTYYLTLLYNWIKSESLYYHISLKHFAFQTRCNHNAINICRCANYRRVLRRWNTSYLRKSVFYKHVQYLGHTNNSHLIWLKIPFSLRCQNVPKRDLSRHGPLRLFNSVL